MNKQDKQNYQSLYGKDWQDKVKSNEDLTKSETKKSPRLNIPDGAEIVVPTDFAIVVEQMKFDNKDYDVESFGVTINGKVAKFFVSWLSNTGFETYGSYDKDTAKSEMKKLDEPQKDTTTANEGDMVELWQSSANQKEAINKIGGKTFIANIVEYCFGRFDEVAKPRFSFDEK